MLNSQQLLEEYIQIWEDKRGSRMDHSKEAWNERAEEWGQREKDNPVTQQRIAEAVKILNQHDLLEKDSDVIDVGCGPCCFVAEFAKTAHHVTGTDLSPKMLEYGEAYCHEQGCDNTSFVPCDFKSVSIQDMGWEHSFDLVFSSMTPATSTFQSLEKMIDMSRGWCCNASCIMGGGKMQDEITQILGEDLIHPMWDGTWFHTMYSIIWLLGYFPESSYYRLQHSRDQEITHEQVENELHMLCREDTLTRTMVDKVYEQLLAHSDNGIYRDERFEWHGFILWDTRVKTRRW